MSVTVGSEADSHDYLQVNQTSWDARAETVCPSSDPISRVLAPSKGYDSAVD